MQLLPKYLQILGTCRLMHILVAYTCIFQAVINSTTTDDGDAPSLNADVSTIPVLEITATKGQVELFNDPPVLHSCLEIPTTAPVDSHAMGDLIGMTQRSDEHRTFE